MLDNGITVYHDGQTRHLELDEQQARDFYWYASMASPENSIPARTDPLSKEEQDRRMRRCSTVEEQAETFRTHLQMLANLDLRKLARIVALLDLMEYGDSWTLEIIEGLLDEVLCSGPAKANERNPRDVLAEVAYELFNWWDSIDTARSQAAQHPELFPTPAAPEPSAAEQTTQPAAKQPAKTQRARNPRKKVAHA